ncbi:MAG TPA: hypothetical protein VFS00_28015, partial [Polyangiaceae bacterium]|nr:hypothetical protein [Polyangiaceae bacterium]
LGGAEYAFRHAIVREAAYATLTADDRRVGHRLAAEWLESRGEGEPFVLARHFEQGGEAGRAVECYLRATKQAMWNDMRAVLHAVRRGVACGAAGETLGELRHYEMAALFTLGDPVAARGAVEEAVQHLRVGGPFWCEAKGHLIDFMMQSGDDAAAAKHLNELLATEPEPDAYFGYARTLVKGMQAYGYAGLPAGASRCLARLDAIERLGGSDSGVRGLWGVGRAAAARMTEGNPWRATAMARIAVDSFADSSASLIEALWARAELAAARIAAGDSEGAVALLDAALEAARARQLASTGVVLTALRAWALVRLGRAGDVRRELDPIRAWARRVGSGFAGLVALNQLARIELALSDVAGAATTAREVLARAKGAHHRSIALAVVAYAELHAGAHDAALVAAREALGLWREEGASGYDEPFLWASLYDALVASGQADGAVTLAREATARFQALAALAPDEAAVQAFLAEPDIKRLAQADQGAGRQS